VYLSSVTIDLTMAPQVPATSPLPSSPSGQTAIRFNNVSLNFLVNSHHDRVLTAYQVRNEFSASPLERSHAVPTAASFVLGAKTQLTWIRSQMYIGSKRSSVFVRVGRMAD
jgi:hypothetical protein